MPDQKLVCVECKADFIFSEKDQAFHAEQKDRTTGLPWGPPKRCKACREARKQAKRSQGS